MQENALTKTIIIYILKRGEKMKLKEFRKKHKLTQTDICIACGVSLPTSQAWERGYSKPTQERREKLINLFKEHGETYEE